MTRSRRAYTEKELRTIIISELTAELGAGKVSNLPPPDGVLEVDRGNGGRTYVGIPSSVDTIPDGRRNRASVTETATRMVVRIAYYTREVAAGKAVAYESHLDTRRQIAGVLARMVDGDGETVPVVMVEANTLWVGEYWAATIDATVDTRTPTTLP